ncbi:hypothetical protein [Ewingella americana]
MSKYDELRVAVSSLVASEDAYWSKLQNVYHDTQRQLREFLGLTDEGVRDGSGKTKPIVQTGLFDEKNQKIQPVPGFNLPKDERKLCFHILINISSLESEDIQISKVILIKVKRNGDEYLFEAESLPSSVKCYEIDGVVNMERFFEEIHSAILKKLNIR